MKPKPLTVPLTSLRLTPEEGFVLSRIDGNLSVKDLVALTGIEEPRVNAIVSKLASQGAVAIEAAPASSPSLGAEEGSHASLADFAAALGMDTTAFAPKQRAAAVPAAVAAANAANAAAAEGAEAPAELEEVTGETAAELEEVTDETAAELEEVTDETPPEAGAGAGAETAEGEAPVEESAEEEAQTKRREADHRHHYETKFRHLETDARVAAASTSSGNDLLALCFDPEPRVVSAILENTAAHLDHARLIAAHHRTGVGLEILSRRLEFLRDMQVERRLLRNPQAGDLVLQKIMGPKRIAAIYKLVIDRELPELTRVKSRGALKSSWSKASSEERADLVLRTEARCMIFLTGCTFDAKATSLLCGRPINSVLCIQNLAKFAATPPPLLLHLSKQNFVRRNPALKKLLAQHPNMPAEGKKNLY